MTEDYDLQTEYIKKFWEVVEEAGHSMSTHLALSHIKLLLAVIRELDYQLRCFLEKEDGPSRQD